MGSPDAHGVGQPCPQEARPVVDGLPFLYTATRGCGGDFGVHVPRREVVLQGHQREVEGSLLLAFSRRAERRSSHAPASLIGVSFSRSLSDSPDGSDTLSEGYGAAPDRWGSVSEWPGGWRRTPRWGAGRGSGE